MSDSPVINQPPPPPPPPSTDADHLDSDVQSERWGLGDVATGLGIGYLISVIFSMLYFVYKIGGIDNLSSDEIVNVDLNAAETILLQLPLWAGLVGACVWAVKRKGNNLKEDFKLSVKPIDVPIGIGVAVAAHLVIGVFYWSIQSLTEGQDISGPARMLSEIADGVTGKVIIFASVAIIAPFVEELFFRGLTLRALLKRNTSVFMSTFLSGLFFAVVHLQGLAFPAFVLLGMAFAWLTLHFKRLGPAIFAHAFFNGISMVSLFLS